MPELTLAQSFDDHWEPRAGRLKTQCHVWLRGKHRHGYGMLKVGDKYQLAHRHSWVIANGEIPDGLCVLHKCDNRPCVNPDHLFLGTQADNIRDMHSKGRNAATGGLRGTRNPTAKLNATDVERIRDIYRIGGTSNAAIGRYFGVTKVQIGNIVHRKQWAHV